MTVRHLIGLAFALAAAPAAAECRRGSPDILHLQSWSAKLAAGILGNEPSVTITFTNSTPKQIRGRDDRSL